MAIDKPSALIVPKSKLPINPWLLLAILLFLLIVLTTTNSKTILTNFSLFPFPFSLSHSSPTPSATPKPLNPPPLTNLMGTIKKVFSDSIVVVEANNQTSTFQLSPKLTISQIEISTSSATPDKKVHSIPTTKLSLKDLKEGTQVTLVFDEKGDKILQILIFK